MSNDEAGTKLFPDTNRGEITAILDFLKDLSQALWGLYNNGTRPELGKRDYKDHNQRIRDGVRKALNRRIGRALDR
jgi:hypothetical protein